MRPKSVVSHLVWPFPDDRLRKSVRLLFCILFFHTPGLLAAQSFLYSPGLRLLSLRLAAPGMTDGLSALRMSANWADLRDPSIGFVYEAWNGVKGTGSGTFHASVPGGGGGFGFVLHHAGDASWGETLVGIAYAREVAKGIRVGLRVDRYSAGNGTMGRSATWPVDLSVSWQAGANVVAGLSVYDPLRVSVPVTYRIPLPRSIRAYAAVRVNPGLSLSAEWESMDRSPPTLAISLSFRYGEFIQAQAGWITDSGIPFLGMGYRRRGFGLLVGTAWQPVLGCRSSLVLEWKGMKKKDR
jgi:hypothetical protein